MDDTISITFGEQAVTHIGMETRGKEKINGFSLKEMTSILKEKKIKYEKIKLHNFLPEEGEKKGNKAYVLIIRNGLNIFLNDNKASDTLYKNLKQLPVDKKILMRGRVVNKRARWNTCFDDNDQEPDIPNGKGTVIAFKKVDVLDKLRESLPKYFGSKASKLLAEMNYYYDLKNCGIGFHGDTERKIVICARLGASMPMHFQWFTRHKPIGERVKFKLNHGDIYIMSEKAVGTDWKKSSIVTLRHAAGAEKYTTIKN
ncbi:hypothetical protein CPAV1605_1458 [seawater metagenome]|uniref:2OG-Fe(II) oxygenase superfamily n=1 Tax=seawater metagenome TaxID=1561972 RepID=A0A5E8CJW6_9ZZZZ